MTQTIDIQAVGRIACDLCCAPQLVKRAAKQLGIQPAYRINNIDHFCAGDIERISQRVRELQQQKKEINH